MDAWWIFLVQFGPSSRQLFLILSAVCSTRNLSFPSGRRTIYYNHHIHMLRRGGGASILSGPHGVVENQGEPSPSRIIQNWERPKTERKLKETSPLYHPKVLLTHWAGSNPGHLSEQSVSYLLRYRPPCGSQNSPEVLMIHGELTFANGIIWSTRFTFWSSNPWLLAWFSQLIRVD